MSQFSRNYSEYLGARRCCDLRGLGPQGNEGSTGPQGAQGSQGNDGSFGGESFQFKYSTDTTSTDPAAGEIEFNNLTIASANVL